jgi:hypothetical protein
MRWFDGGWDESKCAKVVENILKLRYSSTIYLHLPKMPSQGLNGMLNFFGFSTCPLT